MIKNTIMYPLRIQHTSKSFITNDKPIIKHINIFAKSRYTTPLIILLIILFNIPTTNTYFSPQQEKNINFQVTEIDIKLSSTIDDNISLMPEIIIKAIQSITDKMHLDNKETKKLQSLQIIYAAIFSLSSNIVNINQLLTKVQQINPNENKQIEAHCVYEQTPNKDFLINIKDSTRDLKNQILNHLDNRPLPTTEDPTPDDLDTINHYYTLIVNLGVQIQYLHDYATRLIQNAIDLQTTNTIPADFNITDLSATNPNCPNNLQILSQLKVEKISFHRQNTKELAGKFRAYYFEHPQTFLTTLPLNIGGCFIDKAPLYDTQTKEYFDILCHDTLCAKLPQDSCLSAINKNDTYEILLNCKTKPTNRQFHISMEELILEQPTQTQLTEITALLKTQISTDNLPLKVKFNGILTLTNELQQTIKLIDSSPFSIKPILYNEYDICNPPMEALILQYLDENIITLILALTFAAAFTLSFEAFRLIINTCLGKRKKIPHLAQFIQKNYKRETLPKYARRQQNKNATTHI